MSAHPPTVAGDPGASASSSTPPRRTTRVLWLAWGAALVVGIGIGGMVFLLQRARSQAPAAVHAAPPITSIATWGAGRRPAPAFRLTDQHGTPFTLRGLRGRPVIVTFIDPLCRNLCPLEARILSQAVHALPAAQRPRIVAVSVNPWGDTAATFHEDALRWRLPADWRWGVASHAVLARVWHDYQIGVQIASVTHAGVTVHEVSHTEASYLIDKTGHERALFLYPFRAKDVTAALRKIE